MAPTSLLFLTCKLKFESRVITFGIAGIGLSMWQGARAEKKEGSELHDL